MKKVVICLAILSLVFAIGCAPKKVIKPPEFKKVEEVEILDLSKDDITVRVKCLYFNPNPVGCTLENIVFRTFIDNTPLGESKVEGALTCNAKEDFTFVFDTKAPLRSLPKAVFSMLKKSTVLVEIIGHYELKTPIKNINFSLNIKKEVPVRNKFKEMLKMKFLSQLFEKGIAAYDEENGKVIIKEVRN